MGYTLGLVSLGDDAIVGIKADHLGAEIGGFFVIHLTEGHHN